MQDTKVGENGRSEFSEAKNGSQASCECAPDCCGSISRKGGEESYIKESEHWVERRVETAAGAIPVVRTKLSRQDILGKVKVRLGIGRMEYRVKPGLYAVGNPSPESPVLVSANYKLTFDTLRRELGRLDAWILVIDTKGINVWCAAGKGTFGTEELVRRIEETGLVRIVSHRTLVLPQLGAPGVAAHEVTKRTHFKVIYGPVRAADIKSFLAAGMKATSEMRLVRFGLKDRLILTSMELVAPFRIFLIIAVIIGVLDVLGLDLFSWKALYPYLGAILVGGFFIPVLLPWIPGRAFAWKGWLLGMAWAALVNIHQGLIPLTSESWPLATIHFLLLPAISAFLAMGFTGSSTYTSLSGVLKEMRYAVPAILASASIGVVFLVLVLARTL